MKNYVSGFLFFFCLTAGALIGLFWVTGQAEQEETEQVQVMETVCDPIFADAVEETDPMVHIVLNQERVEARVEQKSYCLVAEDGYLIVYDKKDREVSLLTHMPLTEFPVSEQEKLLAGIWFPAMADIFSYLESYTS